MKKLIKYKKNIASALLALTCTLNTSGCGNNKTKEKDDERDHISYLIDAQDSISEPEIEIEYDTTPEPKHEQDEHSTQLQKEYNSLLNSVKTEYQHEEYYPTETQIASILENAEHDTECPYKSNSNLDTEIEEAVAQIRENSMQYINDNPKYCYGFNKDISYDWESTVTALGTDYLLKATIINIFTKADNNINEDFCALKGIKVVTSYEPKNDDTLADYVDKEKKITLYYPTIRKAFFETVEDEFSKYQATDTDFFDYIIVTLSHELNHVRQHVCKHRDNPDHDITLNYDSDIPTTILESSAESSLYNEKTDRSYYKKDSYNYTYIFERESEALLFLLCLTNDSIHDYYNAVFDTNIKALYECLRLENEDDINAFYNILYAIDSLNSRTGFTFKINGTNSITYGDQKEIVGYDYRVDIMRLALKNLMNYTCNHPEFPLEENLVLFSIIKNTIVDDICKLDFAGEDCVCTYDPDVVSNVDFLENAYVSFLGDFYNLPQDEIRQIEEIDKAYEVIRAARKEECFDINNYVFASHLLAKFPFIEPVAYTIYPSTYSYKSFLTDNNLTKSRTLNNSKK